MLQSRGDLRHVLHQNTISSNRDSLFHRDSFVDSIRLTCLKGGLRVSADSFIECCQNRDWAFAIRSKPWCFVTPPHPVNRALLCRARTNPNGDTPGRSVQPPPETL